MPIRAAIYVRASAGLSITPADQEAHLRQVAAGHNLTVAIVLGDAGTVAGKAGQRRPGLLRLVEGIRSAAYEVLIVHSLFLLGRDLGDLITLMMTLRAAGIRLIAPAEEIDAGESGTSSLLDVAALLDAHVRFAKRERILEGQRRARAVGVRIGRPPIPASRRKRIQAALEAGSGLRETGRLAGVSATSVLRVREQMGGAAVQKAPSLN